jgi:hypothetical protein
MTVADSLRHIIELSNTLHWPQLPGTLGEHDHQHQHSPSDHGPW